MNVPDLKWLAGLLEGEGCFTFHGDGRPQVIVHMTDADVVAKAARRMGVKPYGPYFDKKGSMPFFTANLYGPKARVLMRQLYPHMGARRRARIRHILEEGT